MQLDLKALNLKKNFSFLENLDYNGPVGSFEDQEESDDNEVGLQ